MTPQLIQTLILFAHLLTIVNAQQIIDLRLDLFIIRNTRKASATSITYPGNDSVLLYPQGIAAVSEKLISLTSDASRLPVTNSVGRVIYPFGILLHDNTRFHVEIRFKITARGGSNSGVPLLGGGLAFFMSTNPDHRVPNGSSDGNLGIYDSRGRFPETFAVEFDTYRDPGDPPYMHVGINIGSRYSVRTAPVDTSILDQEVTAYISYTTGNFIDVIVKTADSKRFRVSYRYYLRDILRSPFVLVGISAATGRGPLKYDVLYWRFRTSLARD